MNLSSITWPDLFGGSGLQPLTCACSAGDPCSNDRDERPYSALSEGEKAEVDRLPCNGDRAGWTWQKVDGQWLRFRLLDPQVAPPSREDELDRLTAELVLEKARADRAETLIKKHLEFTADGEILAECEKLYCPHCFDEVEIGYGLLPPRCWTCPNPDGDAGDPLPLFGTSCLAKPPEKKSP